MEHNANFNTWYDQNQNYYDEIGISKESFKEFDFRNGFNTGDIMILRGKEFNQIKKGEVIVFRASRSDPIIHRVIIRHNDNTLQTKGDNNANSNFDEKHIKEQQILGRAWLRIPWLGYVKIIFVNFISIFQ